MRSFALLRAGVVLAAASALCGGALAAAACSGDGPTSPDLDATDDFPRGDAFLFGVAVDPSGLGVVENVEVVITPDEGGALEDELRSGVQATDLTNRRGEFSFSGIAEGSYVLFVRFDSSFLGIGEVVGRVRASRGPIEIRIAPPFVDLRFTRPEDRGSVAASDTAVLRFTRFAVDELRTLEPASRPLFARVDAFPTGGGGGGSGEGGGGGGRPTSFEVPLDEAAADAGLVRVPLELGNLSGQLRLEPVLGLHLDFRDPLAPAPTTREIRGRAVMVVRR